MEKNISDDVLCSAFAAWLERSYVEYNQIEPNRDDSIHLVLSSEWDDPEKTIILKDLYDKLRDECKWLIDIIYKMPPAVTTDKHKNVTRTTIRRFLKKKMKWKESKIKLVWIEIRLYLKEIEDV